MLRIMVGGYREDGKPVVSSMVVEEDIELLRYWSFRVNGQPIVQDTFAPNVREDTDLLRMMDELGAKDAKAH